jgi:hypothetical protein
MRVLVLEKAGWVRRKGEHMWLVRQLKRHASVQRRSRDGLEAPAVLSKCCPADVWYMALVLRSSLMGYEICPA